MVKRTTKRATGKNGCPRSRLPSSDEAKSEARHRPHTASSKSGRTPKPRPPTRFERQVYAACAAVPPGRVASYGRLAEVIGTGCARSVGAALRRNPFAPWVPCHRVVASDGGVGGFSGQWGARGALGPQQRRKVQM